MNVISKIEVAVAKLSREDLSVFRDWFQEFDIQAWDKQFENDVSAGGALMPSQMKHCVTFVQVGVLTCETSSKSQILAVLCRSA